VPDPRKEEEESFHGAYLGIETVQPESRLGTS
jgi:hypothetical protein